jgi:hypothetical protein
VADSRKPASGEKAKTTEVGGKKATNNKAAGKPASKASPKKSKKASSKRRASKAGADKTGANAAPVKKKRLRDQINKGKRKAKPGGENADQSAVPEKPKHKHPLPSGNDLVRMLEATGVPVAIEAVARHAGLKGPKAIEALKHRLGEMVVSGRIMKNRKSEYCLVSKIGGITGKVQAHPTASGF